MFCARGLMCDWPDKAHCDSLSGLASLATNSSSSVKYSVTSSVSVVTPFNISGFETLQRDSDYQVFLFHPSPVG